MCVLMYIEISGYVQLFSTVTVTGLNYLLSSVTLYFLFLFLFLFLTHYYYYYYCYYYLFTFTTIPRP